MFDDYSTRSRFKDEKSKPQLVKLSGNFFTEVQNSEDNLGLLSVPDRESLIGEEKSSLSVKESGCEKGKQSKTNSDELERKDATEDLDWTGSRTRGRSSYEEDAEEGETKEVIVGKNVHGDSPREEPAVEKVRRQELSRVEKEMEQNILVAQNEDFLGAEEKIQTAEKGFIEEEEAGEKGKMDAEDFYKDDFVEEDQTVEKDLIEDSLNEKEDFEMDEDTSVTEEDSLEFREEKGKQTVKEEFSEVEGDSLEFEDEEEETEGESTEDNSQENGGMKGRMEAETELSMEDLQEADSLEKEEDGETAEEEPSVSEEDSLEPRNDEEEEEDSVEDDEDSLEREEDEETVEEELSATEEGDEVEQEEGKTPCIGFADGVTHSLDRVKQSKEIHLNKDLRLGGKEKEETVMKKSATEKDYPKVETSPREDSKREGLQDDSCSPTDQRISVDDHNMFTQSELLSSNMTSETNVAKRAVKMGGESDIKNEIAASYVEHKTNEDRETKKTKDYEETKDYEGAGGVEGNTGMIEEDEAERSGGGREMTLDVPIRLNKEEERADRRDFIGSPRFTVPSVTGREVDWQKPIVNQHVQSEIAERTVGGTFKGTAGGTVGETTGDTLKGTSGGTVRGTTGGTVGGTWKRTSGGTLKGTIGGTVGETTGDTLKGTVGGTTEGTLKWTSGGLAKTMEALITEEDVQMTSDEEEEIRRFEEDERRIIEEERSLVQLQEALTWADKELEKREKEVIEPHGTGSVLDEQTGTMENQETVWSEIKRGLIGGDEEQWETGATGKERKDMSRKEDREITGFGNGEASDKDGMAKTGKAMTEMTEEKKPREEQQITSEEDESLVEEEIVEQTEPEEEERMGTKVDEEIVEQKKPMEEERMGTKVDEEILQQKKPVEDQRTGTKVDEDIEKKTVEKERMGNKVDEEIVEQEKPVEEQRTRTKVNEEIVQEKKPVEEQRTRTKVDEAIVEQEKPVEDQGTGTKADEEIEKKPVDEQRTRTKVDEEIVEQKKPVAEQSTRTKVDEEIVEEKKPVVEQRTKVDEEILELKNAVEEQRTKVHAEIVEQKKAVENQRTGTKVDEDNEKKHVKEERTQTKVDEEIVEQNKYVEEQRTRTTVNDEIVEQKKPVEDQRTKVDDEIVEQKKPVEDQRTKVDEENVEQKKPVEEQRTKVDEEIVEQKKPVEDQRTKVDEEIVEQKKPVEEQGSKVDEEIVEQKKPAEDQRTWIKVDEDIEKKPVEEQRMRTKVDEDIVEQNKLAEEQRTRTKVDEEIVEQKKPVEDRRTGTKVDEEIVEQKKHVEEERAGTKEEKEVLEQKKAVKGQGAGIKEEKSRIKEVESLLEQKRPAGEQSTGIKEEILVLEQKKPVEEQGSRSKEGEALVEQKKPLVGQLTRSREYEEKQEKIEVSGKQNSLIIHEEGSVITEKKKVIVNVDSKRYVTEQETFGTIRTKTEDDTEDIEGEIVLEQKMYEAEEGGVSENEERGMSDDEETEAPKNDVNGVFVGNDNRISPREDTRIIEEIMERRLEDAERNTEESIEMLIEKKLEINVIDKKGLGNDFEISEEMGIPFITAYGVDKIGEANDEILCDGTPQIRKKEVKSSVEMAAVISHFGREMSLEESKNEMDDDVSVMSLRKTGLTTGSQMVISEDEESYIGVDRRLNWKEREETGKKLEKKMSSFDDSYVDDVLEPSFAFSRVSTDSELSVDDETPFGEKERTLAEICDHSSFQLSAQSHREESYLAVDENWSGNENVLFPRESLQYESQPTPSLFGDVLDFENPSPIAQSSTSMLAPSNHFPLQRELLAQSEITGDSMLKPNRGTSKRDLELAELLNLPQEGFAWSVKNGQLESKLFGASEEAEHESKTQNDLHFPVESLWPLPTNDDEHLRNSLTFGKSSQWMNDSAQFPHHDQQVALGDSDLVPNEMTFSGMTRESKTLHKDFTSTSGKKCQPSRNSVDCKANGISNAANDGVNGTVSRSGGVNGKVGSCGSGRYHGSVDNIVGESWLMHQSGTIDQLNGSSNGSLDDEEGDARLWRLRGSTAENHEETMLYHPLECIHQTAVKPTCSSLSCLISRLNSPQETQRPLGTAHRFKGTETAATYAKIYGDDVATLTKSSRDDTVTYPVHNYLEGDDLWKTEKAAISKRLHLRPKDFNSGYVSSRNATPRSVADQQTTSSLCVLVDNMKLINSVSSQRFSRISFLLSRIACDNVVHLNPSLSKSLLVKFNYNNNRVLMFNDTVP